MWGEDIGGKMVKIVRNIIKQYDITAMISTSNMENIETVISSIAIVSVESDIITISFSVGTPPDISALIIKDMLLNLDINIVISSVHTKAEDGTIIFGDDAESSFYDMVKKQLKIEITTEIYQMDYLLKAQSYNC